MVSCLGTHPCGISVSVCASAVLHRAWRVGNGTTAGSIRLSESVAKSVALV